jgi:hypothetical protein
MNSRRSDGCTIPESVGRVGGQISKRNNNPNLRLGSRFFLRDVFRKKPERRLLLAVWTSKQAQIGSLSRMNTPGGPDAEHDVNRTGRPSIRGKSSASGRPMSHVEFEFFTKTRKRKTLFGFLRAFRAFVVAF